MGKGIPHYPQPLESQWVPATLSPEDKRPRTEANHLRLSRAEFRNAWTHRFSWVCAQLSEEKLKIRFTFHLQREFTKGIALS